VWRLYVNCPGKFDYTELFDQRRGKRSVHRVPLATAEKALALYQEKYFDLNVRHFQEKLRVEEHIELSYTWPYQRCAPLDARVD